MPRKPKQKPPLSPPTAVPIDFDGATFAKDNGVEPGSGALI